MMYKSKPASSEDIVREATRQAKANLLRNRRNAQASKPRILVEAYRRPSRLARAFWWAVPRFFWVASFGLIAWALYELFFRNVFGF